MVQKQTLASDLQHYLQLTCRSVNLIQAKIKSGRENHPRTLLF